MFRIKSHRQVVEQCQALQPITNLKSVKSGQNIQSCLRLNLGFVLYLANNGTVYYGSGPEGLKNGKSIKLYVDEAKTGSVFSLSVSNDQIKCVEDDSTRLL
eukprot:Platyproteum_vivax@DN6340_c0_g1_i3.p1